jgi:hypothetical protein
MTERCRLCRAEVNYLLTQRVLGRHEVKYFRCPACDLIQTEQPYWLNEAYSTAISALDTGAISRNIFCVRLSVVMARLSRVKRSEPCLDYGGGYGVFTRMMRDAGYNFRWHDKFGQNLFARGFEGDVNQSYRLVTAFEVFEHLVEVRDELTNFFGPAPDFLLVGTLLHTNPAKDWWYFVAETGQHVAFYSRRTMKHVANMFGYQALCGNTYTAFVRNDHRIGAWRRMLIRRFLSWPWLAYGVGSLHMELQRRHSLTWPDHLAFKDKQ